MRQTGKVRAGGKMEAENIVTGVQVHGADAETARALLALAQEIDTGSVEAVQDMIAKNIITGFQYIGQGGAEPDREQFQQELNALRDQLSKAIASGEIEDAYEAEDAQTALDRAIEQSQTQQPAADKVVSQLERASSIIDKAASVAASAGKFHAVVLTLAPMVKALKQLVSWVL